MVVKKINLLLLISSLLLTNCASIEQLEEYERPPMEKWQECEIFLHHPEPAWTNCMMIA